MRTAWSWSAAALAAFCVTVACTEDIDEDPGAGPGGLGGGLDGALGGAAPEGGRGGAGGSLGVLCDPRGPGVCANSIDCPLVTSGQLEETSYACADLCAAEGEPAMCAIACITMELNATVGCSSCYAQLTECAAEACFAECLADPSTDECDACLEAQGCSSDWGDCGGVRLD